METQGQVANSQSCHFIQPFIQLFNIPVQPHAELRETTKRTCERTGNLYTNHIVEMARYIVIATTFSQDLLLNMLFVCLSDGKGFL